MMKAALQLMLLALAAPIQSVELANGCGTATTTSGVDPWVAQITHKFHRTYPNELKINGVLITPRHVLSKIDYNTRNGKQATEATVTLGDTATTSREYNVVSSDMFPGYEGSEANEFVILTLDKEVADSSSVCLKSTSNGTQFPAEDELTIHSRRNGKKGVEVEDACAAGSGLECARVTAAQPRLHQPSEEYGAPMTIVEGGKVTAVGLLFGFDYNDYKFDSEKSLAYITEFHFSRISPEVLLWIGEGN